MTLQELGLMLREEREARGFSLDLVATRLKVSARILRAIEQGDVDDLPHAVYARGFIKAYASMLGITPGIVAEVVDSVYPCEIQEDLVENPGVVEPVSGRGRRAGVLLTLGLVACGLMFAGYWYYKQKSAREQMPAVTGTAPFVEPAPQQVVPAPPTSTEESVPPTVDGAVPAVPAAGAADGAKPVAPEQPVTASNTSSSAMADKLLGSPTPEQKAKEVLVPQQGDDAGALPPAGKHRIIVTAVAECWVHSTADNADVRQFSLRKGETFALTFSRSLSLKLGNAGGVNVRFDGKDMGAPGEPGQVKTLTFPPSE